MMPRRTILLLAIVFIGNAKAQQLYFNHLSVDNGLSQGVNNSIYRDSRGFVWISSFDGLNRFDGMDCEVFRTGQVNAKGLKGTLFLNILEDAKGNVWIGGNEGLNKFDRLHNSFHNYTMQQPLNRDKFYSPFYIDDKQNIWVQSGSQILLFDTELNKFIPVNVPFTNGNILVKSADSELYKPVSKIYAINKNEPVFFTADVHKTRASWVEHKPHLAVKKVNQFVIDNVNSRMVAGTEKGLYLVDLTDSVIKPLLVKKTGEYYISTLHLDNNKNIWAGTLNDGLLKINSVDWQISMHYKSSNFDQNSLSGKQVQYVTTDNRQDLWVAIWGKGIDYTSLSKFQFNHYLTREDIIPYKGDNFTKSIVQVNNEIWCGTQSSGIIILDSANKIKKVLKEGLPPSVEHLFYFNHNVYVSTLNGLYVVNSRSKLISKINFVGNFNKAIQFNYASLLDSSTLLLSTNNGLLISEVNALASSAKNIGKAGEVYLTTYKDESGTLYLSKPFKGFDICRYTNDSLMVIKTISLDATVKCFYETSNDLWIGTTSGLVLFNKKRKFVTRIFSIADGLNNQYVYGIVPDKNFLWLSTNAGLNRFDTKNFSVKTFTTKHGLQSNEFNTYAFCKTTDNEILFGGVNGLNAFYPDSLSYNTAPPQVSLSILQVNDSLYKQRDAVAELDSLSLNYQQNTISFQFTVIDYSNPSENYISYILEGYDKRWITASNKALIRYANLPAGIYSLKVKAYNSDGVVANNVYTLVLSIDTPWWQSWWFGLITIFLAIAAIVMVVRFYFKRKLLGQKLMLEKDLAIEQERNRMARDLHDGLGGMLSGIKHSLSAIGSGITTRNDSDAIVGNTIGMLDASIKELRRVAYNMMPESMLRFGLDASIRDYCYDLSANGNVQVVFQSYGVDNWTPKQEVAISIYRIVQELVTNSLRHANASQVIVQFIKDNNKLNITVEDNGQGFDKSLLYHSKGIGWLSMKHRVAQLKGVIEINSEKGKGVSVNITCLV